MGTSVKDNEYDVRGFSQTVFFCEHSIQKKQNRQAQYDIYQPFRIIILLNFIRGCLLNVVQHGGGNIS